MQVYILNGPEAMIFDLDGVITFTARVHAAWKELFDEFLKARSERLHEQFSEFMIAGDYLMGSRDTMVCQASSLHAESPFRTAARPTRPQRKLCVD